MAGARRYADGPMDCRQSYNSVNKYIKIYQKRSERRAVSLLFHHICLFYIRVGLNLLDQLKDYSKYYKKFFAFNQ